MKKAISFADSIYCYRFPFLKLYSSIGNNFFSTSLSSKMLAMNMNCLKKYRWFHQSFLNLSSILRTGPNIFGMLN